MGPGVFAEADTLAGAEAALVTHEHAHHFGLEQVRAAMQANKKIKLFVRINRPGGIGRTPTGRGSSDGRFTGQAVALIVARTATAAGLDPAAAWSGHSLRRGFATETYRTGTDPLRIARAGGWKDGSATLLGYIDDVDRWGQPPRRCRPVASL